MARYETHLYVSSVAYDSVATWAASTSYAVGDIVRQTSPTSGNERCFICVVAGTSGGSEPSWTLTWGSLTTDNTVSWRECSGLAGLNNDTTNTVDWTAYRDNYASSSTNGQLIKNNAGTHLFMITTGGSLSASEPTWNTTTGATTADSSTTWTCLGPVGSFGTWDAPMPRLNTAFSNSSWAMTDDAKFVFVGHTHDETTSSAFSIQCLSTRLNPVSILSIDAATSNRPPTSANLLAGATVSNTASSGTISFTGGTFYAWGITFQVTGTGFANWGISVSCRMDNCSLRTTNTGKSGQQQSITAIGQVVLKGCSFGFGVTSDSLAPGTSSRLKMINASFVGPAYPATLFNPTSGAEWEVIGTDFTGFGSGKTIVDATGTTNYKVTFERCKFNSDSTKAVVGDLNVGGNVDFVNCDSGANVNYDYERYMEGGTLYTETTVVRTGGASDGTQAYAWRIVTNSSGLDAWGGPAFECPPLVAWNSIRNNPITVTVHGIWGEGAVPTDDDIWMEVEYFGDSASSKGVVVSTQRATPLHTVQNLSSDSSTWGGSTTKFKLSLTLDDPTPKKVGPIYVRVFVGKGSSTFYIDPKIVIS